MDRKRTTTNGEPDISSKADLETVIVRPDDVVNAIRRNYLDQDEQRTHVLRVLPPFDGEKEANLYTSLDRNQYPSDMDPKPLHLSPGAILSGHAPHGVFHPDFPEELVHPSKSAERRSYREEVPQHKRSARRWEEWWNNALDEWKSNLRRALKGTRTVTISSPDSNIADTTIEVVFKSE